MESICVLTEGKRTGIATIGEGCASDVKELTIQLCAHMLEMGGVVKTLAEGRKLAHRRLADGSAYELFCAGTKAQGGSEDQVRNPEKLPKSVKSLQWTAHKRGYITKMDTQGIGQLLVDLGGGRKKASDPVDPRVGIVFRGKLGLRVNSGDLIGTVYLPDYPMEGLEERLKGLVEISAARKSVPKLIHEVMV
jgi:thymidine phosphorylase